MQGLHALVLRSSFLGRFHRPEEDNGMESVHANQVVHMTCGLEGPLLTAPASAPTPPFGYFQRNRGHGDTESAQA